MQAPGLLLALDRNGRGVCQLHMDAYDGEAPRMDNVELGNPAIGPDGTIYVIAHAGNLDNSTYAKSGTLYAIRDVSSPRDTTPKSSGATGPTSTGRQDRASPLPCRRLVSARGAWCTSGRGTSQGMSRGNWFRRAAPFRLSGTTGRRHRSSAS